MEKFNLFNYTDEEVLQIINQLEAKRAEDINKMNELISVLEFFKSQKETMSEFEYHQVSESYDSAIKNRDELIQSYDELIACLKANIHRRHNLFRINEPHQVYDKDADIIDINERGRKNG